MVGHWMHVQGAVPCPAPSCILPFLLHVTRCGGLNTLGPESGTIRRCGLVGVGVALMEEVYHYRSGQ